MATYPIGLQIQIEMLKRKLSKRKMCKRSKTSRTQLLRVLNPEYENSCKIGSCRKLAEVLDMDIQVSLVPRGTGNYTSPDEALKDALTRLNKAISEWTINSDENLVRKMYFFKEGRE